MLRGLKLVAFVTIFTISMFAFLSSVQSANACGRWKPFYCVVAFQPTGSLIKYSNLNWLKGVHRNGWWSAYEGTWPSSESPYWSDRGLAGLPDAPGDTLPPAEFWKEGAYCCHLDWEMGYTDVDRFRYRVWIFWNDDPHENPYANCVGGRFILSHGTGAFSNMQAYGRAWVKWKVACVGGELTKVLTCLIHVGMIRGAPRAY